MEEKRDRYVHSDRLPFVISAPLIEGGPNVGPSSVSSYAPITRLIEFLIFWESWITTSMASITAPKGCHPSSPGSCT